MSLVTVIQDFVKGFGVAGEAQTTGSRIGRSWQPATAVLPPPRCSYLRGSTARCCRLVHLLPSPSKSAPLMWQ